ncbi:MAG: Por secretion system protein [Muribaculaceae bacterium]|nr:Por secretion system protein [Muribaculaceae bacterium]
MKNALITALLAAAAATAAASPQAEKLDRGLIAVKTSNSVFVSWRSLEEDPESMTFDVYRDGEKVNTSPITKGTNLNDRKGTVNSKYVVKASFNGDVVETSAEATVEPDVYKRLHLDRPDGGKTPDGVSYTYTPNDCSVGDVDGDGRYEIFVKWDPSNSHDNSEGGYTGNVFIDCYTLDGDKLWRIDLGRNIRAGAHYTQFMVYDFDGDGCAEMACKTAPGTIDGQGKPVLMGKDSADADYRSSKSGSHKGQVTSGPEYLTMFDGRTGAELSTVAYEPSRSIRTSDQWGDGYGGRSERYLACVAYLDGQKPSLVMCRGYYTAAYLCAWDFDGTSLTRRWLHKSEDPGKGAYGEGAHSLTVGDVDGDGCDEIVYGSACIDHDGSLLYRTGAGHGDALHLGDFDPRRKGLEVFMVHEEKKKPYDCEFRDAATGKIIWSVANSGEDIGRGLAANLSNTWNGYEIWPGSHFTDGERKDVTFDCHGNIIAEKRASANFRIYWDGDLLDELFDGAYDKASGTSAPVITKRSADLTSDASKWTFAKYKAQSCNTTKATPCLQADILGDWREELILWDGDNSSDLLIFTTTITSGYRVPCLMQDHNYRMAIAWQNTGYNQPPHLGYYLPDRMSTTPVITITEGEAAQSVELGYPIAPVSGTFAKATTMTAKGLPEGVEFTVDNDLRTFAISGTPAAAGIYRYTLKAIANTDESYLSGTITVTEPIELEPLAAFSFEQIGAATPNSVHGEAVAHGAPAATDGIAGSAVTLDGTSDYFTQQAYDKIQLGTRDFTIEMWLRSTDDAAYIIHKGSMNADQTGSTSGKWVGLEYKNGDLKFAIDDNTTKSEAKVAATQCFDGLWHHIVAVRESATASLRLYIDGRLMALAPDATGHISDNNEPLVIGNVNISFDNPLKGDIDELSIMGGAMSANKVAERYEARGSMGIEAPATAPCGGTRYLMLVDARTGIVVAHGAGDDSNVTSHAAPGIYILVADRQGSRSYSKIVIP